MRVLELAGVFYLVIGLVLTARLLIAEYILFRADFRSLAFSELVISLFVASVLQTFGWGVFAVQYLHRNRKHLKNKIYTHIAIHRPDWFFALIMGMVLLAFIAGCFFGYDIAKHTY